MPRLAGPIICARGIVDAQQGTLTLVDILDRITLTGALPAQGMAPISIAVICLWYRDPEDGETFESRLTLEGIGPSRELASFPVSFAGQRSAKTVTTLMGMPLNAAGAYVVKVEHRSSPEHEWRERGSAPFDVTLTPAA